ncbi:hypothetical protein [Hymenobacter daeguensis]
MFDFLKSISAKNPNAGRGPEKPAGQVAGWRLFQALRRHRYAR